jgi:hypothetical protein
MRNAIAGAMVLCTAIVVGLLYSGILWEAIEVLKRAR